VGHEKRISDTTPALRRMEEIFARINDRAYEPARTATKFDMSDPIRDLPGLVVRLFVSSEKKSYQISITKDAKLLL
jgi:hypothetical protein